MLGAFCIIPGILFAHNHIKVLCQFGFQRFAFYNEVEESVFQKEF